MKTEYCKKALEKLRDAVHGRKLDEYNRDEGGLLSWPDHKKITEDVEEALKLLESAFKKES